MSGLSGNWSSSLLPSGQTGEAYLNLKRPERAGLKWKDGYPAIRFERVGSGNYVVSVGGVTFALLYRGNGWRWEWETNVQLYPVTASGGATTLDYAKDQIRGVIQHICGTPRPE